MDQIIVFVYSTDKRPLWPVMVRPRGLSSEIKGGHDVQDIESLKSAFVILKDCGKRTVTEET